MMCRFFNNSRITNIQIKHAWVCENYNEPIKPSINKQKFTISVKTKVPKSLLTFSLSKRWSHDFASKDLLEKHFIKHRQEFSNAFATAEDYLVGARRVIENGIKVTHQYQNETRTCYLSYLDDVNKKQFKFEFVAIHQNVIKTYYVKKLWNLTQTNKIEDIIGLYGFKKVANEEVQSHLRKNGA